MVESFEEGILAKLQRWMFHGKSTEFGVKKKTSNFKFVQDGWYVMVYSPRFAWGGRPHRGCLTSVSRA